jgi:uncharacterized protein YybS (DUF2232 family)
MKCKFNLAKRKLLMNNIRIYKNIYYEFNLAKRKLLMNKYNLSFILFLFKKKKRKRKSISILVYKCFLIIANRILGLEEEERGGVAGKIKK